MLSNNFIMAKKPEKSRSLDPSSEQQTRLLQQIKNLLSNSQKDEDDDALSKVIITLIILGILLASFFLLKPIIWKEKKVDPAYSKVEAIKRIKELQLVKHHYETIIPITKPPRGNNEGKLQFLMVAPAEVNGFIDLSKLKFKVEEDSLIRVTLPTPEISQTLISLKNTKEYTFQRSFWVKFQERLDRRTNYLSAYDRIRSAIDSARADVRNRAIVNGILEDTQDKAEDYIRNMINNLGYRVEFDDSKATASVDSINLVYENLLRAKEPEEQEKQKLNLFRLLRKGKNILP